ncbi:hypothetical protein L6164_004340 [Bauhinia variegata]|uniref:Uncharacterized protein n=1 Tax=Bauhinia variegata TaxID=167791 RepID=A0ACB9Q454_BAUVA|nr:hypothetical protein L6164_004340 [Bauhinia variegata]
MPKNEMKAKSGRKPLRDLSNNNGGRYSKSGNLKMVPRKCEEDNSKVEEYDTLDRLLLVHSDLSSLIKQIDELVVQAFKLKTLSKEGRKEIESFSNVVSNMHSSLKPWVPRFQRTLSTSSGEPESNCQQPLVTKLVSNEDRDENYIGDNLKENTMDSLVSPSPLVSWRANCAIERGRQMFMLTPLPISKALSCRRQEPSKLELNRLSSTTTAVGTSTLLALSKDMTNDSHDVAVNFTPIKPATSAVNEEANIQENGSISSSLSPQRDISMLVMTPCLKMSPPKSCVLLEPISEISHIGHDKVRKSTPFPVAIQYNDSETSESESSGGEASQGLALKYPELLGIHHISKTGIENKKVEASPDWFMSPPKTCVLLEPSNEKELEKADIISDDTIPDDVLNQPISMVKNDISKDNNQTTKSCVQGYCGSSVAHMECTPLWNEPESSFRTGKRPGENTLKKELWTKFEAATSGGIRFNHLTASKSNQKGFLALLDEADEEES